MRPSFCKNCSPSKIEGAGNAGRLMRPRPRVRNKIKHTSVVTTVTPVSTGIPRAMVLTAYFVLSPATNSSCHRHPRIKVLSKARSGRLASANLTPATGARTTRLCRPLNRRSSCTLADRSRGSSRPATACAPDAVASTASRPASVTTRDPPLLSRRDGEGYAADLGQPRTEIFLQTGLDRANQIESVQQIYNFPQRRCAPVLPCLSGSGQMRGIEAQTPPDRFCELGRHAVGKRAAGAT